MHKKLDCFVWTLRNMQAYHYSGYLIPRTTRRFASVINGHKKPRQSIYLKEYQLYAGPSWQQSSLQDIQTINTSSADANEKIDNDLLEQQNPELVTIRNTQPPEYLVSSQEESSNIEESKEHVFQQFFTDLEKCTLPCDVLDLALKYSVSKKLVKNCFSAMWVLTKKLTEKQKSYEKNLMQEHPHFNKMCEHLMHEVKFMRHDDLVYTMLAVMKLGIPQETQLAQTMLRSCQERLNDFDNRCLSVLATTLQDMKKCRNVEALRFGLQLLVEQRISKTSDVFILQTFMKCIGKDAPLSLKIKLEHQIFNQMEQLTLPNAQYLFTALAEMNYRSVPILNACSDRVIENIQGIPYNRLSSILRSCKDLQYHNTALYSSIGDYVASVFYMWDMKQVTQLLAFIRNVNFKPVNLMDTFAEKFMPNPDALEMKNLLSVLKSYTFLNYFPKGQKKEFLEALDTALNKYLSRISNVELLRAVFAFCIAGYLPEAAINQLLQDEILHDLVTSAQQKIKLNENMLRTINVCLQIDGNSSTKLAGFFAEKQPSRSAITIPLVHNMLGTLFGDESLFQPNVQASHGYNIDFQILVDVNQKIVVPNTEENRLSDESNIKRIALLCPSPYAFCEGESHPKGLLAMKMRHLRLLGYEVILIYYPDFQKLKKEESLEYLKERIFSSEGYSVPE